MVVAVEGEKNGRRLKELLESSGTAACLLCRSADQVKRLVRQQRLTAVVCGYKFPDGTAEELAGELGRRAEAYGLQKECAYALRHTRTLFSIRSGVLDRLIDTVSPADETFMRRILDPQSRRQYGYDMDLIDWIFCADRKERIYVVEAGGEGL